MNTLELPIRGSAGLWATGAVGTVLGLAAIPLAVHVTAEHPPAPPMPGRIVYTRANTNPGRFSIDLFSADANGDGEIQITNTDDVAEFGSARGEDAPRWSPDGETIAFTTANHDGVFSVWMLPRLGGEPTLVVRDDGTAGDPAWGPDGQCVVYSGAHTGGASTLDLKVWCAGAGVRRLLDTATVDERGPDWSRAGGKIVYEARQPPPNGAVQTEWSLRLVNEDGTGDHALLAWPGLSLRHPRWSPDGRSVAFVAGSPFAIGTLQMLDVSSGAVEALVEVVAGPVAWSPDGRAMIFYNASEDGPTAHGLRRSRAASVHSAYGRRSSAAGVYGARGLLRFPAAADAAAESAQLLGLYVIDIETRAIHRLRGAAGGAGAKPDAYEWGYSPDWWSGQLAATETPTPSPSPTPTARPSRSASPIARASPTATATSTLAPPPTATLAPSPTATLAPSPTATLAPSPTATLAATASATADSSRFVYVPLAQASR